MGSIEATVSIDNNKDSPIGSYGVVDDDGFVTGYGVPYGNITINDGNINATSAISASIGGGYGITGGDGGNITINGGFVTAYTGLLLEPEIVCEPTTIEVVSSAIAIVGKSPITMHRQMAAANKRFFIFVPPLKSNFEKLQNIQDFICCISCFFL